MDTVSVSEAKNGLSALIARLEAGHSITIMDRGRPVAVLTSPVWSDEQDEGRLRRLQRTGVMKPGSGDLDLPGDPPTASGSIVDLLLEERAESR